MKVKKSLLADLYNEQNRTTEDGGGFDIISFMQSCHDLTNDAQANKFHFNNHYNQEIHHCIHVLSRITENHVVLVDEYSFANNVIVEGLAQLIIQNNVPDTLPKYLLALNVKVFFGIIYAEKFLKLMLTRDKWRFIIGTKTLNEYKQYIEENSEFTKYFERILLKEPTVNDHEK
ncbi:unnamed protein product [Rotaria socialis]|uniref:Uncharacterized protein n=1 Tax=Rotaria socialis TaxID=392032 RepID=A0A820AHM3_9BILA|nr:unnamed protein product [Rotaria socialis]CAF3427386.1 unnamed protein product [Rotaria socialis]CAF3491796.1 unnamed protein product [Rotaria socialis]CAF4185567.1 unnamed protein product [Rotaria socialis]CAF4316401.1 unnamed protein product [Rotaria socialis]